MVARIPHFCRKNQGIVIKTLKNKWAWEGRAMRTLDEFISHPSAS
jgi:hypothetical protein